MAFPLDLAAFRTRFGEFKDLPDPTVQARLDDAEAEIDEDVWGDAAELGHGFLAADLMRASGAAEAKAKGLKTGYRRRYEALRDRVGCAHRVILNWDE